MIRYDVYILGSDKIIQTFESGWQFSVGEVVFTHHVSDKKRSFIVKQITHDLDDKRGHVARLSCQEKKVF